MGLQGRLEVEELDDEGLSVRQLEDAAVAFAARLAQEFVRPAQKTPVLAGTIGDRRYIGLAEDRFRKLVAEGLKELELLG
jgi:CHAD domain-containing protein